MPDPRAPGAGQGVVVGYSLNGNRYLNVTSRCTLRCAFCPKFNGEWTVKGYPLRLRGDPTVDELIEAAGDVSAFGEIVFCGLGEPAMRLNTVLDVARALRERGARRIRLNTDGLANRTHRRDVTPQFAGVIDALSVSMNAQNEEVYVRHCRPLLPGSYDAMLDFVRAARVHVPDITVTAIEGLEGVDIAACERIAQELGVKFRRRTLGKVG